MMTFSPFLGSSDYETFQTIDVEDDMAEICLFTTNDEVTLEYNDTVILRFTPDSDRLISGVESRGGFIRDTATVHIIDNDSKYHISSIFFSEL